LIKPTPSKLFKLKEWLTLPEAAKHLSGLCGEEISEADVLRLALDRHLKLSINFVNHAYVKPGRVWHYDEEELRNSLEQDINPTEFILTKLLFSDKKILLALRIDEGKFLKIGEQVVQIEGVWDLPMIGGGSHIRRE
jgi:hypothetical protein